MGKVLDNVDNVLDTVQITTARYSEDWDMLTVYAESEAAPDETLSVSIDDVVELAPMTYNADQGRYEYRISSILAMAGRGVTVLSSSGGIATATIGVPSSDRGSQGSS